MGHQRSLDTSPHPAPPRHGENLPCSDTAGPRAPLLPGVECFEPPFKKTTPQATNWEWCVSGRHSKTTPQATSPTKPFAVRCADDPTWRPEARHSQSIPQSNSHAPPVAVYSLFRSLPPFASIRGRPRRPVLHLLPLSLPPTAPFCPINALSSLPVPRTTGAGASLPAGATPASSHPASCFPALLAPFPQHFTADYVAQGGPGPPPVHPRSPLLLTASI